MDLSDRLNRVWIREGMIPGDIALFIPYRRAGKHRWHPLHREAKTTWAFVEAVEEMTAIISISSSTASANAQGVLASR